MPLLRICATALVILFSNAFLSAQNFPNPVLLNTGSNSTGTGTLSVNSQDLNWTAALSNSVGTFTPAVVVGTNSGWSNSPFSNAAWISYPHNCSSTPGPAYHTCNGQIQEWYRLIINLPSQICGQSVTTASAYCLSLDFMADNCVESIYVNGALNYSTSASNPYFYAGFSLSNKVIATLCNNWQVGTNTVLVSVVSGTNANGGLTGFLAQANQTVNTTVGQPLLVSGTQTSPVCYGGTGSASVTASGALGSYTYSWVPSGGTLNAVSNLTAGNYSCIVTSSGQCSATKSFAIIQPSQQTVNITASSPTACISSSIALTAQVLGGTPGYTYSWGTSTGSLLTVQSASAGTFVYTVGVTDANNCLAVKSTSVAFFAPPVISVGSSSICFGGVATLTASGANSYTWLPAGSNSPVFTVSPASTSFYTVQGGPAGCVAQTITTVTVFSSPSLAINPQLDSVCVGNGLQLSALISGGTSPFNYNWSGGATGAAFTATAPSTGTYTHALIVTDANGCKDTASATTKFFNAVNLSASHPTICPGDTTVLVAGGASTYTWSPPFHTGNSFTVGPLTSSVYSITGTSSNGCVGTLTTAVFVHPAPALSFVTNSINCAHLGSATVSASGVGPFSFSWTPTSQSGSSATNLYPGTYTVSVFDNNTGCLFTPTVNFAPLVPLTATVNPIDSLKCFGAATASASVILAGGSNAQNYLWSASSGSQTTSVATGLSAGTQTVLITDALTFCTVTKTFVVNEPPKLNVSLSASSPSVCVGGIVTLSAQLSGGTAPYTFSWVPSVVSLTFAAGQSYAGTSIYQFKSSDSYSCTASETLTIDHVPYPVVSVSNTTLCPLQPGILTATGATSYLWNTGAGGANLTVAVPTATQFTVTGTTAGCSTNATATVTIKPAPIPAPFSNSPLCERDTLLLGTASSGTVIWTGPQQFSSSQPSINIAGVLPSHSGIYNVTVTAANSCTASASIPVLVNPAPVAGAWSGTVCAGQPLHLLSGFVANGSYLWNGPSSYVSSHQNNTITVSDTTMSGEYTLTLTSTLTGCTNTIGTTAQVKNPVPVNISANSPLCPGQTLILSTDAQPASWFGPSLAIPNQSTLIVGPITSSAQYSLLVQQGPCAVDTTINVLVHPRTQVTIAGDSVQYFCENTAMQFVGSAFPAAASYTWYGTSIQPVFSSMISLGAANLSGAGVYSLFVTDINGCIGIDSVFAFIHAAPIVETRGATVCIGMPASLSAAGGLIYNWSGPGGFSANTTSVFFPVVSAANSGIYSVAVTDSNQCVTTATTALIAEAFPMPVPSIARFPAKACANSLLNLTGSGGNKYSWRGPNAFFSDSADALIFISDSTAAGIYTLTVVNASNCAASETINVSVYEQPKVPLRTTSNYQCVPFCTDLVLDVPANASGPIHNIQVQFWGIAADTNLRNHCFTEPGQYDVRVYYTDSNNCVNSSSMTIVAFAKPEASFSFHPPDPIVNLDVVHFYNHSDCFDCASAWFFGPVSDTSFKRDPTYVFTESGSHAVTLLLTSPEGCLDTLTLPIHIEDEFTLYVPNSFSPNGDGINDFFQAKGQGIDTFHMQVFDRWGELLFTSNSILDGWDGESKGKRCKTDVYTWVVKVKAGKFTKSLTGFVSLLK
jgi:gliding motility-associated-like protein